MKGKKLYPGQASQYQKRKRGEIKRKARIPDRLSDAQQSLAQELADRYGIEKETAMIYLDWYYAIDQKWLTIDQAEQETGINLMPSE